MADRDDAERANDLKKYPFFHILYRELRLKNRSLLEVGCGSGALFGYLRERSLPVHYVGTDDDAASVLQAKHRFPDGVFLALDAFGENPFPGESFDFVVASGCFESEAATDEGVIREALVRLFALAGKAVAFNCYVAGRTEPKAGRFYLDLRQLPFLMKKAAIPRGTYRVFETESPDEAVIIIEKEETHGKNLAKRLRPQSVN